MGIGRPTATNCDATFHVATFRGQIPARLLDTRLGAATVDGGFAGIGVVWLGGNTDGVTHLDQDAPTPAQPVRPPKWAAVLLSVACTAVAGVLFLPLSTAVAVAAGASVFGQPERGPDEWWFPYAMFVFVTVEVVSVVAAFVLSRRRLRYAALPLVALLALIAMVPVLAWLPT